MRVLRVTSCLLVKAPDRLLVVADGRLAVSQTQVSFDQTQKIVRFTPRYRIPRIMMGRFSHYDDYTGRDCFVAYAGTYALVAEVLALFRRKINETLVLTWRNGVASLSPEFDEGGQFGRYDFSGSDYLPLGEREIVTEFRAAAQAKADEFCLTRGQPADCEFLLFGKAEAPRGHYAFKVSVNPAWSRGQKPRLDIDVVADGVLATIGSPGVAGEAHADAELVTGLKGWQVDQEAIGVRKLLADYSWLDGADAPAAKLRLPEPPSGQNWPLEQVATRFSQLLQKTTDASVGGRLLMARGRWYGEIELEVL